MTLDVVLTALEDQSRQRGRRDVAYALDLR